MTTYVLKKKPKTKKEIISAILKLAIDKRSRVLWTDQCVWLETKMKEIARLARKLK